uniref:CLAVATA3/ESR-like protein n=1 Tax=Salix viminalis TaxID=40686 RepID=A0A6N2MNW8_SALVM
MATRVASTNSRAMILLLMVFLSGIFLTSQSRILKGDQAMQGNVKSSRDLLLELGFELSKVEHYQKLSAHGADSDRLSPGGPDPQHH